ncbi:MAG: hypothetical protein JSS76_19995 [Bacteroidetes bacterium]|nr:hypothetical protein [Bacteroidota bacterium]
MPSIRRALLALSIALIALATSAAGFPDRPAILRVLEPLRMQSDTARVLLSDFIREDRLVDSITFSKGLTHTWDRKHFNQVTIIATPAAQPISEMKLWIAGTAYSVVIQRHLPTAGLDPLSPVLHTARLGRGSFTVSAEYSRSPFAITVYWQNYKLGRDYIKRVGEELMITIPTEAQRLGRSYIRVYACDDRSRAADLLIPLDSGQVVNTPTQLGNINITHLYGQLSQITSGLRPKYDPAETYLTAKPMDTIARTIRLAMDAYGAQHVFSALQFAAGTDARLAALRDTAPDRAMLYAALLTALPLPAADSSLLHLFPASDTKHSDILSRLTTLRSTKLALLYGETDIASKGDILLIRRTYFSQSILIVINRSLTKQSIETGTDLTRYTSTFAHPITGTHVDLPPLSFEVLTK